MSVIGMWNYNTAARVNGGSDKDTPDTTAEASPAKVSIAVFLISAWAGSQGIICLQSLSFSRNLLQVLDLKGSA